MLVQEQFNDCVKISCMLTNATGNYVEFLHHVAVGNKTLCFLYNPQSRGQFSLWNCHYHQETQSSGPRHWDLCYDLKGLIVEIKFYFIDLHWWTCVTAQGSCVLLYQDEENSSYDGDIPPLTLAMVGWRGTKSMRAYVPLSDCVHYLRLCGADVSKYGECYNFM